MVYPKRSRNPKNLNEPEAGEEVKPRATAYLPYVHGTTDWIGRLLSRHNVQTVFRANRKLSTMIRSSKDIIPNEAHGVYEIPCGSCEKTYIGLHIIPRIYREAVEIEKRGHSMNTRDDSRRLPTAWRPILRDCRVLPSPPLTMTTHVTKSVTKASASALQGLPSAVQHVQTAPRRITRSQTKAQQ
jgi:hypothetical protein